MSNFSYLLNCLRKTTFQWKWRRSVAASSNFRLKLGTDGVLATSSAIHHVVSAYSCNKAPANARSAPSSPVMPDVTHTASVKAAVGPLQLLTAHRRPKAPSPTPPCLCWWTCMWICRSSSSSRYFFTAGLLLLLPRFHTFCLQTPFGRTPKNVRMAN